MCLVKNRASARKTLLRPSVGGFDTMKKRFSFVWGRVRLTHKHTHKNDCSGYGTAISLEDAIECLHMSQKLWRLPIMAFRA